MQFMPSTWVRWGVDANGDGVADPWNPTDAVFSAARYLAAAGGSTDLYRGVYAYNHADWYVREVLSLADVYGTGSSVVFSLDRTQQTLDAARGDAARTGEAVDDDVARGAKEAAGELIDHRVHAHARVLVEPPARLDIDLLAGRQDLFEHIAIAMHPDDAVAIGLELVDEKAGRADAGTALGRVPSARGRRTPRRRDAAALPGLGQRQA